VVLTYIDRLDSLSYLPRWPSPPPRRKVEKQNLSQQHEVNLVFQLQRIDRIEYVLERKIFLFSSKGDSLPLLSLLRYGRATPSPCFTCVPICWLALCISWHGYTCPLDLMAISWRPHFSIRGRLFGSEHWCSLNLP
jgi:hypothetical protein